MVKVAENRVIDLDVFPGNEKGGQLAEQARDAVQGKLPSEGAHGVVANTEGAVSAVAGTLGGGIKGVVDTAGNTVGSLAQGLQGTVQGVGDGIGSTAQFTVGAVGAGVGQVGNYVTGEKSKTGSESHVRSAAPSQSLGELNDNLVSPSQAEKNVLPDAYGKNVDTTAERKSTETTNESTTA